MNIFKFAYKSWYKNLFQTNDPIEIEILYGFYFQGLEYTVYNLKIVTINMEISKFSKSQSQCSLKVNWKEFHSIINYFETIII